MPFILRLLAVGAGVVLAAPAFANAFGHRWRTLGIPVVSQLEALRCPTLHRRDIFLASMFAAGWKQDGWELHFANNQHTFHTRWVRRGQVVTSVHQLEQGTFCLLIPH